MALHFIINGFAHRNQNVKKKKKKSQHFIGPLDNNFHLDLMTVKAGIMTIYNIYDLSKTM